MKNKKIVPIFFASDKNYIPFLTIAVKSLADHINNKDIYKVYILSNDLTYADIKEIKSFEKSNLLVEIVDVNKKIESVKNKMKLRDYYTVSIYFRLFIPTLFPEYDKAIYLDSDIVVNQDIAKLYNVDIGQNYVGAVLDEAVYSSKEFVYYIREALDITEKQYFNSGVLIMNLKKFRDNDIENDFYDWVNSYNFGAVAPDQDYLNCISKNKVKLLAPGWNKMPMDRPIQDNKLYLIHYNMFMKPWKYENIKFEDYFWKTAETTSLYGQLKLMQKSYTNEKKQSDHTAYDNLIKLALNIANSENNYKTLVLKKEKSTLPETKVVADELFVSLEPSTVKISHRK